MSDTTFYNQLQQVLLKMLEDVDSQTHNISSTEKLGFTLGSSIGCVRKENQDRTLFFRALNKDNSKTNFAAAILCDGMGGMIQGGECASLATSIFVSWLVLDKEPDLLLRLKKSVQKANDAVFKKYHGEGGSTLVAVVCDQFNNWIIASVGDSRIYKAKLGFSPELLTIDDTVERQLDLLGKSMTVSSELGKGLTQFIGVGESLEVHLQSLIPQPNEIFILTSDGAHDLARDDIVFSSLVVNSRTPHELVGRILSISDWLGGKDNATAAVISTSCDFNLHNQMGSLEIWSPLENVKFFTLTSDNLSNLNNGYLSKPEKSKPRTNKRKDKAVSNIISKSVTENDIARNSQSSFQIDIVEVMP
jgi:PPM family protein phosphatase